MSLTEIEIELLDDDTEDEVPDVRNDPVPVHPDDPAPVEPEDIPA